MIAGAAWQAAKAESAKSKRTLRQRVLSQRAKSGSRERREKQKWKRAETMEMERERERPSRDLLGTAVANAFKVVLFIIIMLFPAMRTDVCAAHEVVILVKIVKFLLMVEAQRVNHGGKSKVIDQVATKKVPMCTIDFPFASAAPMIAKPVEPGCHLR